ncbi:NAD-dependent epimerase/dehydratase family protein, partial [Streptomyces vinaceus]|uniref:NAD-dependent epimerase/dehydratase family protein n=1 Tax=Streptomyces vinaceus TaxID=1960 RepID=UPI0036CB20E3
MRIAITGSSGLIGQALVRSLRADGHEVVRFVRRTPSAPDEAEWDPRRGHVDPAGLTGCGAVVHLAGAGGGGAPGRARGRRRGGRGGRGGAPPPGGRGTAWGWEVRG